MTDTPSMLLTLVIIMVPSDLRFSPGGYMHSAQMASGKRALPRLSTVFTGRQDILQQLAQYLDPTKSSVVLKKQRIFVLHGLGGAGKTQIMAKFVDEFGDQCDSRHFTRERISLTCVICFQVFWHLLCRRQYSRNYPSKL